MAGGLNPPTGLDVPSKLVTPETGIGLAVPGRPIRARVAEDRSAEGVRDRTGPELPRRLQRLAYETLATEGGPSKGQGWTQRRHRLPRHPYWPCH
jgi:hypothetical protein